MPAAPIRYSPRQEFVDQPTQTTTPALPYPPRTLSVRAQRHVWSARILRAFSALAARRKFALLIFIATLATPAATAENTLLHPTPCDPINTAPQNIACYNAKLPQNHAAPADHNPIHIAIADLNPSGTGPAAAILSGGGPGGALYLRRAEALAFWDTYRQDTVGKNGRLILIDQRGAGDSRPALTCPEEKAVFLALMPAPQPRQTETRQFINALQTCLRRHSANGTHPAFFTTAASADDANAIRRALGIPRWHLIGFSYGARLALETARRHPASVAALVLDSPPPFDAARLPPPYPLSAALQRIAADCQRQKHCRRHGSASQNIAAALALVANPAAPLAITLHYNGERALALTPARLAALLRFGLYDSTGAAMLPFLARQLAQGDTNTPHAQYYASAYLDFLLDDNWASLLNWRINCQEFPHPPAAAPATQLQKLEQQEWDDFYAICNAIFPAAATPAATAPDPVITHKPVLLISGFYDPATPPQWSAAMAARLPNAQRVTVPAAHTPSIALPCLRQAIAAFVQSPTPPAPPPCQTETLTFH